MRSAHTVHLYALHPPTLQALWQELPGGGVGDVKLVPVGALLILPNLGAPHIEVQVLQRGDLQQGSVLI